MSHISFPLVETSVPLGNTSISPLILLFFPLFSLFPSFLLSSLFTSLFLSFFLSVFHKVGVVSVLTISLVRRDSEFCWCRSEFPSGTSRLTEIVLVHRGLYEVFKGVYGDPTGHWRNWLTYTTFITVRLRPGSESLLLTPKVKRREFHDRTQVGWSYLLQTDGIPVKLDFFNCYRYTSLVYLPFTTIGRVRGHFFGKICTVVVV